MSAEFDHRVEVIRSIFAATAKQELERVMQSADPNVVADWSRSRGLAAVEEVGPHSADRR